MKLCDISGGKMSALRRDIRRTGVEGGGSPYKNSTHDSILKLGP